MACWGSLVTFGILHTYGGMVTYFNNIQIKFDFFYDIPVYYSSNNSLIKKPCGFELVHRLITGTQDNMNPKEIFRNF
jgi:hypothetical protein